MSLDGLLVFVLLKEMDPMKKGYIRGKMDDESSVLIEQLDLLCDKGVLLKCDSDKETVYTVLSSAFFLGQ
jgi:hypothetical protein